MDATSSQNKLPLVKQLALAYPHILFTEDELFRWEPITATVHYSKNDLESPRGIADLFHELGHATLQHKDYTYDVTLIQLEAEAWNAAFSLSAAYGHAIDDEHAEQSLNSYREWLHARSTCPACQSTGLQTKKYAYECVNCRRTWRVNDAKFCALRRTIT